MTDTKTIMGYRVSIEIECETEAEIVSHLIAMRQTMVRKIKQMKSNDLDEQTFEDNNCYGTHKVKIEHAS